MREESRVQFMQGNAALLEGALAAGADFFAGYPITPSSEIAELASRRLPARGGIYLQMEDELASMAAVIGASLAGRLAFTATSGPGFSLMQENLGLAIMAEVPCVVINVQRSGPSTGLATRPAQADVMQARWGTHGDHSAIVLCASTVQACYRLAARAFQLAERFRHPVVLLADEVVGHMRERVVLDREEQARGARRRMPNCAPDQYRPYQPEADGVPPLAYFGSQYVFRVTGSMHDERGFPCADPENAARVIERLSRKIQDNAPEIWSWSLWGTPEPEILLVSFGAAARACRAVVEEYTQKGHSLGLLELETLWPFPAPIVRQAAARARLVVVAEMNLGQMRGEVRKAIPDRIPVLGANRFDGEPLTPGDVRRCLQESGEKSC